MHYNFRMAEVRKYFFCTDNLTACKIIGGVEIAVIISLLAVIGVAATSQQDQIQKKEAGFWGAVTIIFIVIFGLRLLSAIFLVVAASKRSAKMLMVWIILNCIGIAFLLIGFSGGTKYIMQSLIAIGFSIWALLIAIGARQEVQKGANIA